MEEKDIDPLYFYDCHYLEPEEVGAKPFSLLREALQKTGRGWLRWLFSGGSTSVASG
ncbi:MAG: Ku protein [Chloroflexota bacterium]